MGQPKNRRARGRKASDGIVDRTPPVGANRSRAATRQSPVRNPTCDAVGPVVADRLDALARSISAPFQVETLIAVGSQGAVYQGRYLGQPVAIKIFPAGHDHRRLALEVGLLQKLNHPNIVKIRAVESVSVNGAVLPLVAYDYVAGGDLRRYLLPGATALTAVQLIGLGTAIASVASTLWHHRVVHRDISPANILGPVDAPILCDFATVRYLDAPDFGIPAMAGKHGYMAPEVFYRRQLTANSDLFSLGVTLYELAARQHPFRHRQDLVLSTKPLRLASLRPDLPPTLTTWIDEMLVYQRLLAMFEVDLTCCAAPR